MAKILIVDDEEKIREMLEKYATHEGHEIKTASNGKKALEIFEVEDFDVVIMDVMMPEMDGYETLKKMREIRNVHCIFLTALGQEYDRIHGFDVGGEDYVTKPFSLKELMMRINVMLKRDVDETSKVITIDDMIVDENAHIVTIDGNRIDLANKEIENIKYMSSIISSIINERNALKKEET